MFKVSGYWETLLIRSGQYPDLIGHIDPDQGPSHMDMEMLKSISGKNFRSRKRRYIRIRSPDRSKGVITDE